MGLQERRSRQKLALRKEILEAARELFVREGFDSVSMRKIADKIEYSPTTIYNYFRDKADLLDCIVEETFLKLEARLAAIHQSVTDPRQRLHDGVLAYVEFGTEHSSEYRVAFLIERKGEHYPRCAALGQKLLDHVRQSVADCIAAGVFPERDIEASSLALWAAFHGITSLLILRPDFPWPPREALLSQYIDTVIQGLERRPTAAEAARS
jgi:AcrR family transcriptional regulator